MSIPRGVTRTYLNGSCTGPSPTPPPSSLTTTTTSVANTGVTTTSIVSATTSSTASAVSSQSLTASLLPQKPAPAFPLWANYLMALAGSGSLVGSAFTFARRR